MRLTILSRILSAVVPNYGTQAHSAETADELSFRLFGMSRSEALAYVARERELATERRLEWLAQAARDRDWIPLREKNIAAGSIEIRIWRTYPVGLRSSSEVTLIQREGLSWTGFCHDEQYSGPVAPNPVMGWDGLWETIEKLGILSLPDSSMLPLSKVGSGFMGGEYYSVEINDSRQYRAYSYDNPAVQDWPEAKRLLKIVDALRVSLTPYDDEVVEWNCKFQDQTDGNSGTN
jgi:hypothetical protein